MWSGMVPDDGPDEMNQCGECGKLMYADNIEVAALCRPCYLTLQAEDAAERQADNQREEL